MLRHEVNTGFESFDLTEHQMLQCRRFIRYQESTSDIQSSAISAQDAFQYLKNQVVVNNWTLTQLATSINVNRSILIPIFLNKSVSFNQIEHLYFLESSKLTHFARFILERLYYAFDLPYQIVDEAHVVPRIIDILRHRSVNLFALSRMINIEKCILKHFFYFYGTSYSQIMLENYTKRFIEANSKITRKAFCDKYNVEDDELDNIFMVLFGRTYETLSNVDTTKNKGESFEFCLFQTKPVVDPKLERQAHMKLIISSFYKKQGIPCNVNIFQGYEIDEVIRIIAFCDLKVTKFFEYLEIPLGKIKHQLDVALQEVNTAYFNVRMLKVSDEDVYHIFHKKSPVLYFQTNYSSREGFYDYLKVRFGISYIEYMNIIQKNLPMPKSLQKKNPSELPLLLQYQKNQIPNPISENDMDLEFNPVQNAIDHRKRPCDDDEQHDHSTKRRATEDTKRPAPI